MQESSTALEPVPQPRLQRLCKRARRNAPLRPAARATPGSAGRRGASIRTTQRQVPLYATV